MARARAWPRVVLPTPGTPSISKCPRASTETKARRTTSSLPRITLRSAFSSCVARRDAAIAVSADIEKFYYARAAVASGRRRYERHVQLSVFQLSALSRNQTLRALVLTDG